MLRGCIRVVWHGSSKMESCSVARIFKDGVLIINIFLAYRPQSENIIHFYIIRKVNINSDSRLKLCMKYKF